MVNAVVPTAPVLRSGFLFSPDPAMNNYKMQVPIDSFLPTNNTSSVTRSGFLSNPVSGMNKQLETSNVGSVTPALPYKAQTICLECSYNHNELDSFVAMFCNKCGCVQYHTWYDGCIEKCINPKCDAHSNPSNKKRDKYTLQALPSEDQVETEQRSGRIIAITPEKTGLDVDQCFEALEPRTIEVGLDKILVENSGVRFKQNLAKDLAFDISENVVKKMYASRLNPFFNAKVDRTTIDKTTYHANVPYVHKCEGDDCQYKESGLCSLQRVMSTKSHSELYDNMTRRVFRAIFGQDHVPESKRGYLVSALWKMHHAGRVKMTSALVDEICDRATKREASNITWNWGMGNKQDLAVQMVTKFLPQQVPEKFWDIAEVNKDIVMTTKAKINWDAQWPTMVKPHDVYCHEIIAIESGDEPDLGQADTKFLAKQSRENRLTSYVGIVGSSRLTEEQQQNAKKVINEILDQYSPDKDTIVSGGAKGIDTLAIEIAEQRGFKTLVYKPKEEQWESYKIRNLRIAKTSNTAIYSIVTPARNDFDKCYHCNANHTKSGGCWTLKQSKAKERKVVVLDVASNGDSTKIFVFGSNLKGIHGAGAAKAAFEKHGAIYGQGYGRQGNSYAIPTKRSPDETLSLNRIKPYVEMFLAYAKANPQLTFEVTAIGCGLAGYKPQDIAPMFQQRTDNVKLPQEFL